jgi:Tfp pilus assembly protein PilE
MKKRRFEIVIAIIIVSLLILISRQSNRNAISTVEMVEKLRDSYSQEDDFGMENSFFCYANSSNINLDDN